MRPGDLVDEVLRDRERTPMRASELMTEIERVTNDLTVLIQKINDAMEETGLFQKEEDVVLDDEGNARAAV